MAISTMHPSQPTTCLLGTDRRSQCGCVALCDLERVRQIDFQVALGRFRHKSFSVCGGQQCDFKVRPPHMHECERLHADYSDVRQVSHVEDSSTKCSRNDDSRVS